MSQDMLPDDLVSLGAIPRFILHSLEVIDLWRNEEPGVDIVRKTFQERIIDAYESTEPTPGPTKLLLKSMCKEDVLVDQTLKSITERLRTKSNERSFRAVKASVARPGEDDNRVRTLLEQVLREDMPFALLALVCAAFPYIGDTRTRESQIRD